MLRRYTKNFILTAGFPCQDVSIAGRRAGLAGKQTGLFVELARIINEIRPEWFVLENVPGLLSSNEGKDFWTIITTLEQIGYCVAWRILDAQYFGVAQRRKRVWIVGSFGNTGAAEILFEQESSGGDDKKIVKMEQREIALCLNTRSGEHYNPTNETIIAQTITAGIRGNAGRLWEDTFIAETDTAGKREVDGVSGQLYLGDAIRGKGLGNSIVPQIAIEIFKRIKSWTTK